MLDEIKEKQLKENKNESPMVPPSLPFTLTASCCRGERYFQATSAILRLPRGPVEWEGSSRVKGRGRGHGIPGKCSVVAASLSKSKASVRIDRNYSYQYTEKDG